VYADVLTWLVEVNLATARPNCENIHMACAPFNLLSSQDMFWGALYKSNFHANFMRGAEAPNHRQALAGKTDRYVYKHQKR